MGGDMWRAGGYQWQKNKEERERSKAREEYNLRQMEAEAAAAAAEAEARERELQLARQRAAAQSLGQGGHGPARGAPTGVPPSVKGLGTGGYETGAGRATSEASTQQGSHPNLAALAEFVVVIAGIIAVLAVLRSTGRGRALRRGVRDHRAVSVRQVP